MPDADAADDVTFPPELLAAQNAWSEAEAAVDAFDAAHPGSTIDWPEEDRAELERLRGALVSATLALHSARAEAGPEWDNHTMRMKLKHAAAGAEPAP